MAISARNVRWSASYALLHPAWWASLIALLLNDHLLKGAGLIWPALTGKISDFAGLVVSVLLRGQSRRVFAFSHLAVGGAFSALKLSEPCATAWCGIGSLLGCTWKVVSDPTDLIALPMLAVSLWLFGPRLGERRSLPL